MPALQQSPVVLGPVSVNIRLDRGEALQAEIGTPLFFELEDASVTSEVRAQHIRTIREYGRVQDAIDAGETAEVVEGLRIYFGQKEYPKPALVCTQVHAAQPGLIFGDALSLGDVQGIGASASFTLAGSNVALSGLDSVSTIAAAVSIVNTAVDAAIGGATCTLSGQGLLITVPSATTGFGTGVTNAPLGLKINSNQANVITLAPQSAVETAAQCYTRVSTSGSEFYFLTMLASMYADQSGETGAERILAYGNAQFNDSHRRQLVFEEGGPVPLTATDTSSLLYQFSQAQIDGTNGLYSGDTVQNMAAAYTAIFASVDFAERQSIQNGANQQLFGTTATTLSNTQASVLDSKMVTYYRAATPKLGYTVNGTGFVNFTGERFNVDWLSNTIATDLMTLLLQERNVPQNDTGRNLILSTVRASLDKAFHAGVITPGELSAEATSDLRRTTGNTDFTGALPSGSYVFMPSFDTQSEADRQARKATPISVWLTGPGSVNKINISGFYSQ